MAKTPNFTLNVMAIRVKCQAKISKETMLLDGIDVDLPNWRVCGRGLNHSVNEGMKDISYFYYYFTTIHMLWILQKRLNE